jgi:hypothetical protein
MQRADVFAAFYDAQGDAVIETRGADTITGVRFLGRIMVPGPNTTINFSYVPGSVVNTANPAKLWLTN